MRDTPRTNLMITGNSDPSPEEYEELATFTRQLERQVTGLLERIETHEVRRGRAIRILEKGNAGLTHTFLMHLGDPRDFPIPS